MVCGYNVPENMVGTISCFGCHFAMKDGSCSWTQKDGVNELDGPSAFGPGQILGRTPQ